MKNIKRSDGVDFRQTHVLKDEMVKGFDISSCWVDDARLVLLNIQQVTHGAKLRTIDMLKKQSVLGIFGQSHCSTSAPILGFERHSDALRLNQQH